MKIFIYNLGTSFGFTMQKGLINADGIVLVMIWVCTVRPDIPVTVLRNFAVTFAFPKCYFLAITHDIMKASTENTNEHICLM